MTENYGTSKFPEVFHELTNRKSPFFSSEKYILRETKYKQVGRLRIGTT